MSATLTPERKLKKAKIDVMRSTLPGLRLWAGIMAVGKTAIDDTGKVPSACTNGRDEFYGRSFVEALPVKQLAFVCLHESMHKGLRHLTTWKALWKIDPKLANMACDYVVNRMIMQADPKGEVVEFPKKPDGTLMGLYDKQYDGMSARQIFDILRKKQKEEGGGGDKGEGDSGGFDDHDWEGAESLSQEEKDALEQEVDHALRRGEAEAKKCGGGKGDFPAEIGQLLRPAIDWRAALKEFVSTHCANKDTSTWRRLNRRFLSMDLAMPTLHGESLGHIGVGPDLSGSMWHGEPPPISRIFTEIVEIANTTKPERMDVMYWDTRVAGHDTFDRSTYEALLTTAKPKGGGGTDAACVPVYMKENKIVPDCMVMITDGYVSGWGENYPCPVLWVVLNNPGCNPPMGKVVHVTD